MPNFEATFTDGATIARWADPPTVSRPSRINPAANHPLLRWLGAVGVEVELSAIVGGVIGPSDDDLDGETFIGWFAEYPGALPPGVSTPVDTSSVRRFTPTTAGHYTYALRRWGGGGYLVHLDVL